MSAAVSVSVGVTAVPLDYDHRSMQQLYIQSLGAGKVYIGVDNTVTTATGFQIPAGGFQFDLVPEGLWLIADTAAQDVRLLLI